MKRFFISHFKIFRKMKMKSFIAKVLLVAVILTAGMFVSAQRGYGPVYYSCCETLPGLTDKQKIEIAALEKAHRDEMDSLRSEHQQTGNYTTRDAWLASVTEKVTAHRAKVRSLLNEDQKILFDQLQSRQGNYARRADGGRGRGVGVQSRGRDSIPQGRGRGFRGRR